MRYYERFGAYSCEEARARIAELKKGEQCEGESDEAKIAAAADQDRDPPCWLPVAERLAWEFPLCRASGIRDGAGGVSEETWLEACDREGWEAAQKLRSPCLYRRLYVDSNCETPHKTVQYQPEVLRFPHDGSCVEYC